MQSVAYASAMNPSVIGADVDACFAHFTRRIGDLALQSEANRSRVAQLGGSELLVALLQRASDDAVLEGAAVALSNFADTMSVVILNPPPQAA